MFEVRMRGRGFDGGDPWATEPAQGEEGREGLRVLANPISSLGCDVSTHPCHLSHKLSKGFWIEGSPLPCLPCPVFLSPHWPLSQETTVQTLQFAGTSTVLLHFPCTAVI